MRQSIVTLDMEGVLTPEIWIAVAEKTGVAGLRRTTRDEPDYDRLMRYRLDLLDRHGLTLSAIQEVIGTLQPLEGGRQFLDELRAMTQVIILSDTFEQFARPLLEKLGWPTLFCNRLEVENDRITGYRLRVPNQKLASVKALKQLITGWWRAAIPTTTRPCSRRRTPAFSFARPSTCGASSRSSPPWTIIPTCCG